MMLGARTAAWSGKSLPYDAEVEYLESTGKEWIDTGVIPVVGYTYNIRFQSTGIVEHGYLFGVNWKDDDGVTKFLGLRRFQAQARFQALGFYIGNVPYEEGLDYDIVINGGNNGTQNIFKLSDGRSFSINGQITNTPTSPMYLLAVNNLYGAAYKNKVHLYSFSIEKSGDKIMDLIPVRKRSIGYMYDRVSGKLFGNQGTGAFIIGLDKTT